MNAFDSKTVSIRSEHGEIVGRHFFITNGEIDREEDFNDFYSYLLRTGKLTEFWTIDRIEVYPDCRHKGHGSYLIKGFMAIFTPNIILTDVRVLDKGWYDKLMMQGVAAHREYINIGLIPFWESNGFEVVTDNRLMCPESTLMCFGESRDVNPIVGYANEYVKLLKDDLLKVEIAQIIRNSLGNNTAK